METHTIFQENYSSRWNTNLDWKGQRLFKRKQAFGPQIPTGKKPLRRLTEWAWQSDHISWKEDDSGPNQEPRGQSQKPRRISHMPWVLIKDLQHMSRDFRVTVLQWHPCPSVMNGTVYGSCREALSPNNSTSEMGREWLKCVFYVRGSMFFLSKVRNGSRF